MSIFVLDSALTDQTYSALDLLTQEHLPADDVKEENVHKE